MFTSRWKADVMWHNDTTSWSSPTPSEGSLASFPSFSQGTEVDGHRPRPEISRSSETWLSVSFFSVVPFSVWETSVKAGWKSKPEVGIGFSTTVGPLRLSALRGLSLFSSFRINRESVKPLEETRFLGDGGRCLPWRALSSCPRCHSAWSPEPLPRRTRLFSLGALDFFWKRKRQIQKNVNEMIALLWQYFPPILKSGSFNAGNLKFL